MVTVWFLVQLFASASGDHWTLRNNPVEFPTLTQCDQAGIDLMIDRRNARVKLHCIEAYDEQDLSAIMLRNFNFGGQGV